MSRRLAVPRGGLALVAVALSPALAACGGSGGAGDPLTVSAASSLKTALPDYRAGARYSFAGSDELAAQIRSGTRPDVFAAANTELPQQLFDAGLVERPVVFASNRLVIAVPAGGARVRSIGDLARPGTTIAAGAPSVPIGSYTREAIARLGGPRAKAILANIRSNEPEVAGVVGKVIQRAVDAGFVYASDVTAAGPRLDAIELPSRVRPRVAYAAAVVKGSKRAAEARGFISGLLRGSGARALRDAGLEPPPES